MKIKFDSDFQMTINGKSVNTLASITVINPANEEIVGHAHDCTPELLNEAVIAATIRDIAFFNLYSLFHNVSNF